MTAVGVCGYGTIGKRVADAIEQQPDMELIGAAKRSGNYEAVAGSDDGIDFYAAGDSRELGRAGIEVDGDLDDLIAESDVMVDATPSGVGERHRSRYAALDTPAVFQGGESTEVAESSFGALANFERARGAETLRVVSCNTTGLSRLLAVLEEEWAIDSARGVMVRRGGDPAQTTRGPIDDIVPDPIEIPSHHANDLREVLPHVDVTTFGIKVPATHMHLQCVHATLETEADESRLRNALEGERRISVLRGGHSLDSCGSVMEFARDLGRPRNDVPENVVWGESITVDGDEVYLMQAIHQESIVVPENVDAIRAIGGDMSGAESRRLTNETLDLGLESNVEVPMPASVE